MAAENRPPAAFAIVENAIKDRSLQGIEESPEVEKECSHVAISSY